MKYTYYLFLFVLAFYSNTNAQSLDYCPKLTYTQYIGSKDRTNNGDTTRLQTFLKQNLKLGDDKYVVTGYFGLVTKNFVQQFQSKNNLIVTGIVGEVTRNKILNLCTTTLKDNTNVSQSTYNTFINQPTIKYFTSTMYQQGLVGVCEVGIRSFSPCNGTALLNWSVSNISSCSISGGPINNATLDPLNGVNISPTKTTIYTLNCIGKNGQQITATTTVNIEKKRCTG